MGSCKALYEKTLIIAADLFNGHVLSFFAEKGMGQSGNLLTVAQNIAARRRSMIMSFIGSR